MNLSNTTLSPALAATLLVAAAAMSAALAPPLWHAQQGAQAASLLACELAHTASPTASPTASSTASPTAAPSATHLVITNRGNVPLPARSAFSWASLGTPAPLGGMQTLAQDLAPGDSVRVDSGAMLHAAGCLASLVPSH